jgi:cytochrome c oxidase accessory protein FixG
MAELDAGKLTSVDSTGARIGIIPAEVKGFYRRHRIWSQWILLVIFLALPWTTVNGRQTIFLNIADREFALFSVLFKAHDTPLVFFLVAAFLLGLAFVTSIWGRVWCGWACPQTVFIDAVYRRIEILVEGNYIQRRKLRDEPLTAKGFLKKSTKWFLFLIVSSLIAHSFIAYFAGAHNLIQMMSHKPSENGTYFWLVLGFTAAILFNFGWFREQFCVIMCPYGRMQGLLLGPNSKVVSYDAARGEPRKAAVKDPTKPFGDCVSCLRCVQVCPTGIDIRNGLQMECINCTACMDACDEIMEKVHKPKGLIRPMTLDGKPSKLLSPRPIIYLVAIIALLSGLAYSVAERPPVQWTVMRGLGLPYSTVKTDGAPDKLMNHFKIHVQNQSDDAGEFLLSMDCLDETCNLELTVAQNPLHLDAGQSEEWHAFVKFAPELVAKDGKKKIRLQIQDVLHPERPVQSREAILLGPKL